jgi:anti-sigma B factor antagonist
MGMPLDVEYKDRVAVCRVRGDLDSSSSAEMIEILEREIGRGAKQIVLDLAGTPYIDSSGLGALVMVLKKARLASGDVKLCGLEAEARKVLELTRLDRIFDVSRTADDAVKQYMAGAR